MRYEIAKAVIIDKVDEAVEHLSVQEYAQLMRELSEDLAIRAEAAEEEM